MTTQLVPGISYVGGLPTLALAAVVLMIINILVKPMLHVLFLPLNLLTLGLFSWVINVIALFILVTILPEVQILPYQFPGLAVGGVEFPAVDLNILSVAVLASLLLAVMTNIAKWMVR